MRRLRPGGPGVKPATIKERSDKATNGRSSTKKLLRGSAPSTLPLCCGRSGLAQRALRLLGEALKRCGIVHRQVSQDFAVELHACRLQSVDELVVAQAVQLGGSADAHDPQRTEVALFLAASSVGKLQAALDGLLR